MSRRHVIACWLCLLTGLAFAAILASSSGSARAEWPPVEGTDAGVVNYADPKNWPNDPNYKDAWNYWSFVPSLWQGHVTEQNKRLGTGSHLDRAWARTTGDRRILIAEIDSGNNWSTAELVNKWYLNRGELKPPTGCPGADGVKFDVNGDGVFNVQDYTTATGHQLPSFDKACDPRVIAKGDGNANNLVDPQDLIVAFSDGKDDDANGYIDDISGWDFFRNDNDPFDEGGYGHGNGAQRDSAAEGNNGQGLIGSCPDCSIQSLRLSDTYVFDGSDFAMALVFAVDSGSSVIEGEGATINNAGMAQAAVDYAYANNVVFTIDSSDLNSFHHNQPNSLARTFAVHAIQFDTVNPETATTFLNFHNCSNYGANIPGSVPGQGCASEAVGIFSGIAGLVYSAALKADIPAPPGGHAGDPDGVRRLTTEEAYQIFINGMDDLYDPADATDPTRFPTKIGWDQRFGYGRSNARKMVDLVLAGKIPPEVELKTPDWWQVIYPDKTPMVRIDGRVMFRNQPGNKFGDNVDFVLEWAPGVEPEDNAWKTIAQGAALTQGMDGPLGMWDVSKLEINNPPQPLPDGIVNKYLVTLRLRALVHSIDPNLEGIKGEARRTVFIYKDPDLLPGFPIHLGASGESSPKIVDLDGDGKRELVLGDAAGRIHAFRADGTELPGWPVRTKVIPALDPVGGKGHATEEAFTKGPNKLPADWRSTVVATPAIGDIDGDGKPEVFIGDMDGNLYAFKVDGSLAPGWPQTIDRSVVAERGARHFPAGVDDGVFGSPVMADFDGDKVYEIVVADMSGNVTVWKGNGTKMAGWPVRVWDTSLPDDPNATLPRQVNRIMTTPAVGDLNGDGTPDIVVGTNEDYENQGRLYAIDGKTAKMLPNFPLRIISVFVLPMVGSGLVASPALADLDGDGKPEIVIGGIGGGVKVFTAAGKPFTTSFVNSSNQYGAKSPAKDQGTLTFISSPAFGDIDDDGVVDLIFPTVGLGVPLAMASGGTRHDLEHHLSAWDTKTGAFKEGFPQVIEDYTIFHHPIVADVDGDGKSEAICASAGYFIHAWRADGTEAAGFPKFTGQWNLATAAVGDMDGDGKLELAMPTREGWLYVWHTQGKSNGRIDWESFHHDARNTGNYDVKLEQGVAAMPMSTLPMKKGCGCRVGERASNASAGGLLALLAGVGLVLVARRRRASL